jgi:hypothetical protein
MKMLDHIKKLCYQLTNTSPRIPSSSLGSDTTKLHFVSFLIRMHEK